MGEISRTKTIRMVPLLCGLASRFEENIESLHWLPLIRDKSGSQKIVFKVVKNLGAEDAEYKNTEEYLRYLQTLYLGISIRAHSVSIL